MQTSFHPRAQAQPLFCQIWEGPTSKAMAGPTGQSWQLCWGVPAKQSLPLCAASSSQDFLSRERSAGRRVSHHSGQPSHSASGPNSPINRWDVPATASQRVGTEPGAASPLHFIFALSINHSEMAAREVGRCPLRVAKQSEVGPCRTALTA